jgi:peptidoglycan/xylan/chitin deacetylase (PgdA/CDA1 family)
VLGLTFDMDAEMLWENFLRRNGVQTMSPRTISQGSYEPKAAVPKLLELFERYGLKTCFFIPGRVAEMHPDSVKKIVQAGHEIGHHSHTHVNLTKLSYEAEQEEFERAIDALKRVGGTMPQGFRSPAGDFSTNTLNFLKKYHFVYDSSMIDDDVPYLLEKGNNPIVEIPTPPELDDWIYYGFNMLPPFEYQTGPRLANDYLEALTSTFDAMHKEGDCMVLVLHPQAEGRPARLAALERFIKHVKEREKTWITTPSSIAKFWLKKEGF